MWYRYDEYGWYAGDIIGTDTSRATQLEPQSLAIHNNVGQPRANFSNGAWSIIPFELPYFEPEDLTPIRADRKAKLYNEMKIAEAMPIFYEGHYFPTDYDIRSDIVAIIAIGILPDGFFWFDVEKNPILINDINYMKGLAAAIANRKMYYYVLLSQKNAQVDSAVSAEEIETVEWQ